MKAHETNFRFAGLASWYLCLPLMQALPGIGREHTLKPSARWPVSRRDEFPSQERPLQQLENQQPLRRSQAVVNSHAPHPLIKKGADIV